MDYKRVAVWGVGKCMEDYYLKIKNDLEVVCFVDNNLQKTGEKYTEDEIVCVSCDMLKDYTIDIVLIAVYDMKEVSRIMLQLKKYRLTGRHIIDAHIDIIHQKEELFLGKIGYDSQSVKYVTEDEPIKKVICLNLPTHFCNFRCDYCYVFQHSGGKEVFEYGNRRLVHKSEYISYALRRERLGGTCFIDICASGETLYVEGIVDLIYTLLREGHIIRIVTNATATEVIKELINLPDNLSENLFFTVSVHYLELKKRNLIDIFFQNLNMIKESSASLTMNLVGSDIYYPYIDEIIDIFQKRIGGLPQVDMARDDKDNKNSRLLTQYSKEEYLTAWRKFSSLKFEHREKYMDMRIKSTCLAGEKYFYVDVFTGEINPCVQSRICMANLYNNMDRDFAGCKIESCPASWCVNSIYAIPFGMVEGEVDEMGFGDRYNRIDKQGKAFIKPKLLKIMNQKIV